MTLATRLLPALNRARTKLDTFGLRRYTVTVRTRTWSSGEVGRGTPTDSDLTLEPNPKVREKDDRTLEISHITPSNGTIGYTMEQLRPLNAPEEGASEFFYVVTGPNGTINYQLTAIDMSDGPAHGETSGSLRYTLTLSSLNRAGPQ